jgi:hypothetical protein
MANKSEHKGSNGTMHLVRVYQAQDVQDKAVQRKDMTLEIYQILLPDSLSLVSFCAARETSHVEGPIIFSRVTSCVGGIPECLRTAQFHRPMTDLPSLPRYEYSCLPHESPNCMNRHSQNVNLLNCSTTTNLNSPKFKFKITKALNYINKFKWSQFNY